MKTLPVLDTKGFWRDGYSIVRGAFSAAEITTLRRQLQEAGSREHPGDLLSDPVLRDIVLDDRILEIARRVLQGTPVYFGDGSLRVQKLQQGFHKDNVDRTDPKGPDWRDPYTLIRFGIYLQDHARHSGGLNVRQGSHMTASLTSGRNVYLQTKVGDVAFWSLRTTHSGNGVLLRLPGCWTLNPNDPLRRIEHRLKKSNTMKARALRAVSLNGRVITAIRKLPEMLAIPHEQERWAIFFTIGLNDQHLDRYLKYLQTRQYALEIWQHSVYDPEVLHLAQEKGLDVIDMHSRIGPVPAFTGPDKHAPIPY